MSKWIQLQLQSKSLRLRESNEKSINNFFRRRRQRKKIAMYKTDHPAKRLTEESKRASKNGQRRRLLQCAPLDSLTPHL